MSAAPAVELEPEIAQFRDALIEGYLAYPELASADMARKREIAGLVRARWSQGGPVMADRHDLSFVTRHGPVTLRVLRPEGAAPSGPAMLYCHGGGFVTFSLDTHERLMREYAARAGITVIGIDYALSPEVRWPVALEQVVDTIATLRAGGIAGLEPARLAVGGDSAGANLALSACLLQRDTGKSPVDALLLNYGFFGSHLNHPSNQRYGAEGELLSNEELQGFLQAYLDGTSGWQSAYALPELASDLAGLPPSFHAIAACDPLADQGMEMAQRMQADGGACALKVYPGACHSFLEAVSISPLANRALDEAALWLKEALQPL